MKKLLSIVVVLVLAALGLIKLPGQEEQGSAPTTLEQSDRSNAPSIAVPKPAGPPARHATPTTRRLGRADADTQVAGTGVVVKVLPDDNDGSRHQKFILKLETGQTVLVAHNIDLAPRIPGLERGDRVGFHGEYEWNDRGGVVHWTHHDPGGRRAGGWIRHRGTVYK